VAEVALVIAVGETRGELSQIALADWLATQRAEALWTGTPPGHQDEFHMRLLLRSWLRTISAFEAEANVVPSRRQLRTGERRSNFGWRGLGRWNRTSSTFWYRRFQTAGLGGGTPSRSCIRDKFKIGRLHQRPVGRLRIGTGDRLQMEIPAGLIAELSGWFLGLTTRLPLGTSI